GAADELVTTTGISAKRPGMAPLFRLVEAGGSLEPVKGLTQHPLDDASIVVAVRQDMVECGEAVRLARLLHLRELLAFKLVVFDGAPVVSSVVHRETWGEGAVRPHDQRIASGTAIPLLHLATHEETHFVQAAGGVDHFVTRLLLLDEPIYHFIHLVPVL